MAYPDRLLADDEEVVLNLHPHWKVLVTRVLALLVICALTGFALAVIPDGDYQGPGRIASLVIRTVLAACLVLTPGCGTATATRTSPRCRPQPPSASARTL